MTIVRFGYHYSKFHYDPDEGLFESVKRRANQFEEHGFEFLSFTDHMWQAPPVGQRDDDTLDAYSALAATAAVTEELTLSPMVTAVQYRNPAMVGRMIANIDVISRGRVVFGIGAGWYEEEYDAYGYEYPDAATRVSQVEDATRLLKALWTRDSPVTYEGEHYDVEDAYLDPKPRQNPHPPILIGGGGEQLTLRVVAKHADWWNTPWLSHELYEAKLNVLRDHCEAVGRAYGDIRKSAVDMVVVRDSEAAAHEAYERLMAESAWGYPDRDEYRGAIGTPESVAEHVREFGELGADLYIFEAPRNDAETIDRFVNEVVPLVE